MYFDNSTKGIFPDERIDSNTVYFGFFCSPLPVPKEKGDIKVPITIFQLILDFFRKYPDCLLVYVCSSLNKQDRNRAITFGKWYKESPARMKFEFFQKKINDEYYGILYSKNHPDQPAIEDSIITFTLDKQEETFEEPDDVYLSWQYSDNLFD